MPACQGHAKLLSLPTSRLICRAHGVLVRTNWWCCCCRRRCLLQGLLDAAAAQLLSVALVEHGCKPFARPIALSPSSSGLYKGPSPLSLLPIEDQPQLAGSAVANPVVTCANAGPGANYASQPFLHVGEDGRTLHMFFTRGAHGKNDIGVSGEPWL